MSPQHSTGRPVAPDGYDHTAFPSFAVTVDVVILTIVERELMVLLIERGGDPYAGSWALPGGFKRPDETLDDAAARELEEETAIRTHQRLVQFGAYGDPGRDPRTNVVTVGYLAVVPDLPVPEAGSDAANARLWPVRDVLRRSLPVAFDHRRIIADALERAQSDLEQTDLALRFVRKVFTLSELRAVFEIIWGADLEAANFRRSLIAGTEYVTPSGGVEAAGATGGRPAQRYRATKAWRSGSPIRRPRVDARRYPSARLDQPSA